MISWLYISSINNIIFVLYETNNIYIKKTVGSIHNLVYSKIIEFVFGAFILGYMLAINKEYNYRYNVILYGILHGFLTSCEQINYCHQRETKQYNIEKFNNLTIVIFESFIGIFNYNANLLVSSYLISVGAVMIDSVNINNWYINEKYFDEPTISSTYDLESPFLDNGFNENLDYNRKLICDKYVLIHLLTINANDLIVRTTISPDNIVIEIAIFYVNSLVVSTITTIIYIKRTLKSDIIYDFNIENKTRFLINYLLLGFIGIVYNLCSIYALVIAPSILYVKAISKSWGLILLECIGCHNNITNFNDLNIFGSLVIVYPMIIFYLTCYYQT